MINIPYRICFDSFFAFTFIFLKEGRGKGDNIIPRIVMWVAYSVKSNEASLYELYFILLYFFKSVELK